MRALSVLFLVLLATTLVGCFDGRPITRLDSGPVIVPMDGGDPGIDSGPIIIRDSGPGCVAESSASACTDFTDNDCDLQVDCNDTNCCSFVTCATGTVCGNMRVDAGTDAGRDAGPTSCPAVTFPGTLAAGCLPRCSASTLSTASACTTNECFIAALDADTTPSISATIGSQVLDIDCRGCVGYHQQTCMYDSCPADFTTWAGCDETVDPDLCEGEWTTLTNCTDASSGFGTCFSREFARCFP